MSDSMHAGEEVPPAEDALPTAIALSGGGHRATLWALGVLLYIADAGRRCQIRSIASVSGGSLANAAVGYALDYGKPIAPELEGVLGRTARRAANGTVFAWWGTWAYLLVVPALAVVVGVG